MNVRLVLYEALLFFSNQLGSSASAAKHEYISSIFGLLVPTEHKRPIFVNQMKPFHCAPFLSK